MGHLLAPRAFGRKKCVVRAFVVRPDTNSFIHSCFSFWCAEASRNPGFLRGIEEHFGSVRELVLKESWGFFSQRRFVLVMKV